jgi:pyridoxal phosphate enzyme (YggS family)
MSDTNRPAQIAANLAEVEERITRTCLANGRNRSDITLIAVTKTFPISDCQILYELGVRDFGENRDEEATSKFEAMPNDVRWHFQGQIQSRKITSICHWAAVIHSLDSIDHASKFSSRLVDAEKSFFVQVNLEPGRVDRGGIAPAGLKDFLVSLTDMTRIAPIGLMAVAPLGMDPLRAFRQVRELRDVNLGDFPSLNSLSIGMSHDFESAISAGATHVRIGSSILGSRAPLT